MKTIEEKAKAYDESVERAKQIAVQGGASRYLVTQIFPELAESDDEKIRKALIRHFNDMRNCVGETWGGIRCDDVISYLERQKEPSMSAERVLARAGLKPYKDGNQWCILVGDNIQEGICGFGETIDEALYQFLMEVLEMKKEQKPVEWSEDERIRKWLVELVENQEPKMFVEVKKMDVFAWLERQKEQKPVENPEKDNRYWFGFNEGKGAVLDNPEEYGLCKPVEWSEEDEKKLNDVICIVGKSALITPYREHYIRFLKSLRPSWKPSDEQMGHLRYYVETGSECLRSLYDDLKKL